MDVSVRLAVPPSSGLLTRPSHLFPAPQASPPASSSHPHARYKRSNAKLGEGAHGGVFLATVQLPPPPHPTTVGLLAATSLAIRGVTTAPAELLPPLAVLPTREEAEEAARVLYSNKRARYANTNSASANSTTSSGSDSSRAAVGAGVSEGMMSPHFMSDAATPVAAASPVETTASDVVVKLEQTAVKQEQLVDALASSGAEVRVKSELSAADLGHSAALASASGDGAGDDDDDWAASLLLDPTPLALPPAYRTTAALYRPVMNTHSSSSSSSSTNASSSSDSKSDAGAGPSGAPVVPAVLSPFPPAGTEVAIKRLRLRDSNFGFNLESMRELSLLAEISHPNIVRVLDIYVQSQEICIVMERLKYTLTELITNSSITLDLPAVKTLSLMAMRGVAALHDRDILHRDLKPDNFLIDNDNTLKLADFGGAKVRNCHCYIIMCISHSKPNSCESMLLFSNTIRPSLKALHSSSRSSLRRTRPQHVSSPGRHLSPAACTLWYRAPELLFGSHSYGPASDVWSLGCIIAEMLLRGALFPGVTTELSQLTKIITVMGDANEGNWPGVTSLPHYVPFKPTQPVSWYALFPQVRHTLERRDLTTTTPAFAA